MPPSLAQQDRPRAVLSLSVLKIPPRSRLHSLSQLPTRDLIAQKHFLMANLNLPGHDSSRVFIFFLLSPVHGENIPCSQQSPELSARVAGTARLEVAPMLWAVWPQSLRTWGRGEQAWSSRNQSPTMERREKGRGMFRAADNPASWHCLKMSNIYLLPELPCAS